jgi:hypothetical protein
MGGSLAIAALIILGCIIGLVDPTTIYSTKEILRDSLPADLVNLLGMPLLLVSIWLARHGRLVGLLLWPGALFYLLYHDVVFLFARPLSALFLLHLVLATLNLYALASLVFSVDGMAVRQRLAGRVPEKVGAGVLVGLGVLFFLWAIAVMVTAFVKRTPIDASELAVRSTDVLLSPSWIIGGLLLWRREALGYVVGLGLLFQASMLFIGLIALFLLQSLIFGNHFRAGDVLVIFAMGLFCFVPFAFFARGAASQVT